MSNFRFSFKYWYWVALVALPLAGRGQGYVEGASLSAEMLPLTVGDSHFRAYFTRASAVVPLFLKKDQSQAVLLGAGAEMVTFDGNRPGFDAAHLYAVAPVLGYSRQVTPALRLTGLFIPTLSSDFQRVRGEDVRYGGLVRGVYRLRPALALRAALGYRQTFYGPTYLLLAGLDWQASTKVRVFGDLPASLTAVYAAAPQANAGVELTSSFGSYRLAPDDRYVRYRTFVADLFAEYYVRPRLALRATAGYSLVRNLELYNRDDRVSGILDFANLGTAPTPLSPAIGNGVVLRLALSFRVPAL